MDRATARIPEPSAPHGLLFTPAELDAHRLELERLRAAQDAVSAARAGRLEQLLRDARAVAVAGPPVVAVGTIVEVEYPRSGRIVTYRVTGTATSAGTGTLSAGSPVGRALMGHGAGAAVAVALPNGRVEELRVRSVRLAG